MAGSPDLDRRKNTALMRLKMRQLVRHQQWQVKCRKVFFSVLVLASIILVLQLLVDALFESPDQASSSSLSRRNTQVTDPEAEAPEPPYYTITSVPEATEDMNVIEWQQNGQRLPVIHVLHTRFMQQQPTLTSLAQARLLLFQVFCLPTIVHQSTQHFIWIMKVDPELDRTVLSQLVELLESYDNFFLVAANTNYLVNPKVQGAWRDTEVHQLQHCRDGQDDSNITSSGGCHIYTGNRQLLTLAMALSHDLPVVETRLDADDGLHKDYMRHVQERALKEFSKHPNKQLKYKYWCSRQSIEWHWQLAKGPGHGVDQSAVEKDASTHGMLQVYKNPYACITPGITVAMAVGVQESECPTVPHHKIVELLDPRFGNASQVPHCGTGECLEFVNGKFAFDAIRSRTPTSAGMLDILQQQHGEAPGKQSADSASAAVAVAQGESKPSSLKDQQRSPWTQYSFWNILYSSFAVSREQVEFVQGYIQGHRLHSIAKDNLEGQCQGLHSCKQSAKNDLEKILKLVPL